MHDERSRLSLRLAEEKGMNSIVLDKVNNMIQTKATIIHLCQGNIIDTKANQHWQHICNQISNKKYQKISWKTSIDSNLNHHFNDKSSIAGCNHKEKYKNI